MGVTSSTQRTDVILTDFASFSILVTPINEEKKQEEKENFG